MNRIPYIIWTVLPPSKVIKMHASTLLKLFLEYQKKRPANRQTSQ